VHRSPRPAIVPLMVAKHPTGARTGLSYILRCCWAGTLGVLVMIVGDYRTQLVPNLQVDGVCIRCLIAATGPKPMTTPLTAPISGSISGSVLQRPDHGRTPTRYDTSS
jgi:hypothetical protein